MSDRMLVSFAGDGSGDEELTWGQEAALWSMQRYRKPLTMGGVNPVRPGRTVDDAADTLRYLMGRHQALRTRLRFDAGGRPRQVLSSSGEVPLELVDAGTGDPAEVAAAIRHRYETVDFDYEREWPVRMALVGKDGELTHSVVVYLQLAMDALAMDVLMADLAKRDASSGRPPPLDAIQPLELARQQRTEQAQRQCAASIRHFEQVLRTVRPSRFSPVGDGQPAGTRRLVKYTSPAALLAVNAVAGRKQITTAPVLLAAYAVAVVRITGNNPFVTMLAVSNRFRPRLAESVSPLAQVSPCLIDVAGITVDQAVDRAWRASMRTYKHAYYRQALRLDAVERASRERGVPIDLACYFNDRRQDRDRVGDRQPTAEQIHQLLPLSQLRPDAELVRDIQELYFSVDDLAGAVEFTVSGDSRYVAPADVAELARGIEAVAVEAALAPDTSTGVAAEPLAAGQA